MTRPPPHTHTRNPWYRIHRSFRSLVNATGISEAEKAQLLAGAGFNEQGHSLADVFYTVAEVDSGTWLFSYNLYYSWNGCSNEVRAVGLLWGPELSWVALQWG